jgi:hypothetical protein
MELTVLTRLPLLHRDPLHMCMPQRVGCGFFIYKFFI